MELNEEDFDALLGRKMRELDHSYPPALADKDTLWSDIERHLPDNRQVRKWKYWLAAAASVALLLVASWWFRREVKDNVNIVYRTETIERREADSNMLNKQTESAGLSFIEEQCRQQRPVCSSDAFLELKSELDQLNLEARQVKERMKTFGPDPALVKAEIRLENHKAYLIRELIEILKT
jgi:hypothetical protein